MVSGATARQTAPMRSDSADGALRPSRSRARLTVPVASETTKKSSATLEMAPRPVPGEPEPVLTPSCMAVAMSSMPGPRSTQMISMSCMGGRAAIQISASRACRTRLVASSVATSAERPMSSSPQPMSEASATTWRLTSPTRLASPIGNERWVQPRITSTW